MASAKIKNTKTKSKLHIRNKHNQVYDFKSLIVGYKELSEYVFVNKYDVETLDFSNPDAVKSLNKALLIHFYNIKYWDIPNNYLCPPIPGRADYIHYLADLLGESNNAKIPIGKEILCLDIGTGANCIYPIIGNREYGWSFIASDIDAEAIRSAKNNVDLNSSLKGKIKIKLQKDKNSYFEGIITKDDFVDISMCNPPFHVSAQAALKGSTRKISNLTKSKTNKVVLNFGGQSNELWCDGGEANFVKNMAMESKKFSKSCLWFTTLVSKESNLKDIYSILKSLEVENVKTINMAQGNKVSRIVAWTFLNNEQRNKWAHIKWK